MVKSIFDLFTQIVICLHVIVICLHEHIDGVI